MRRKERVILDFKDDAIRLERRIYHVPDRTALLYHPRANEMAAHITIDFLTKDPRKSYATTSDAERKRLDRLTDDAVAKLSRSFSGTGLIVGYSLVDAHPRALLCVPLDSYRVEIETKRKKHLN